MSLLATFLSILWLQLFWSLVPTWRFGEYYAYGWFVPPIAFAFAYRRWKIGTETPALRQPPATALSPWGILLVGIAILSIAPLRIIAIADAGWRPPILLHALIVIFITHFLLWRYMGAKFSKWLLPVTIFSFTAVPYLWTFEQHLVRKLTGAVINLAREIFLLGGQPVEVAGERLVLGQDAVEVTDGCSGIRSLQSLVMAALFFGESLFLSLSRRLILLIIAAASAIIFNTARAWMLADVHFTKGKAAADASHDLLGHIAFVGSAALLFLSAYLLQNRRNHTRRVVTRSRVAPI